MKNLAVKKPGKTTSKIINFDAINATDHTLMKRNWSGTWDATDRKLTFVQYVESHSAFGFCWKIISQGTIQTTYVNRGAKLQTGWEDHSDVIYARRNTDWKVDWGRTKRRCMHLNDTNAICAIRNILHELRYANILGRIIALTGRVNQAVQNAIRGETNIIRTQTKVGNQLKEKEKESTKNNKLIEGSGNNEARLQFEVMRTGANRGQWLSERSYTSEDRIYYAIYEHRNC